MFYVAGVHRYVWLTANVAFRFFLLLARPVTIVVRFITAHCHRSAMCRGFVRRVFGDKTASQRALEWAQHQISFYGVTNLTTDWADGTALCTLVEAVCPGSCPNCDMLKPEKKLHNAMLGLLLMRKHLGITEPAIKAEEIVNISGKSGETKIAHLLSLIRVAVAEKKRASGEHAPSAEDEGTKDGCNVSGARIVRRKRTVRLMVAVGGSRDGVVQSPGGTPMSQQENGTTLGSWVDAVDIAGTPSVSEGVVEAIDEGARNTDAVFDVLIEDSTQAVRQDTDGDSGVHGRTDLKPNVTTSERIPLEFDCGRSEYCMTRQLPSGQEEHELCDETAASVLAAIPLVGDILSMNQHPQQTHLNEKSIIMQQAPSERICTNGFQTSNESLLPSDSKPKAQLMSSIFLSKNPEQLEMFGHSTKARRRRIVSLGMANGKKDSDNGAFIRNDIDCWKIAPTAATSKRMSLTEAETTRTGSSNTTCSQAVRSRELRDHLASNETEMTELSTDEKSMELADAYRESDTERQPTSSYTGLLASQELDTFNVERMLSCLNPGYTQCNTRGVATVGVDRHRYANSADFLGHASNESRRNAADLDLSCGAIQLLNVLKPTDEDNVIAKCKETSIDVDVVAGGKTCTQFNSTVSDTSKRCGWRKRQNTTSFDRGACIRYRRRKNFRTPFARSANNSLLQTNTGVSRAYWPDRTTKPGYASNENIEKTTFAPDAAANCAACTQHGVRTITDRPDQFEVFGAGLHHGYVQAKNIFQVWTNATANTAPTVTIVGPAPHCVTETSVVYTGDNLYDVTYDVTWPGDYVIRVMWLDLVLGAGPFVSRVTYLVKR